MHKLHTSLWQRLALSLALIATVAWLAFGGGFSSSAARATAANPPVAQQQPQGVKPPTVNSPQNKNATAGKGDEDEGCRSAAFCARHD